MKASHSLKCILVPKSAQRFCLGQPFELHRIVSTTESVATVVLNKFYGILEKLKKIKKVKSGKRSGNELKSRENPPSECIEGLKAL